MFEMPLTLFGIAVAVSFVFIPIGLVTRREGFGYIILITAGMFLSLFSLAIDSFSDGYFPNYTEHYNQTSVEMIHTVTGSEPNLYAFEDLPKALFVLTGAFISVAGAFLLVRDK